MSAPPLVGEVELLALMAVLHLGVKAYAVPIRALIRGDVGVGLTRGIHRVGAGDARVAGPSGTRS